MVIGINASSALKENPTGVEEYVFQLIKRLAMIPESREHRFVLYLNPRLKSERLKDFEALPNNFQTKFLSFPFLWTQIRLAYEMLFAEIDVLFIPAHILPLIHSKKTVATVHGLEYEFYPELYPFFHRKYLRWSTKYALKNAAKIISVSENTKRDLIKLYGGNPDKINAVNHGVEKTRSHFSSLRGAATTKSCLRQIRRRRTIPHEYAIVPAFARDSLSASRRIARNDGKNYENYILYIGRVELKKNLLGIIEAYDKLKAVNPKLENKLVLAGGEGFGFSKIKDAIDSSRFKSDIILKGYVSETEKNNLLENAAVFLYPSFYEGFGMPVLEAQAAGVPVIASNASSLPEVAGDGAILVDPRNAEEISSAIKRILTDESLRQNLIQKGLENAKKFSWEKCARETLKILVN